ncbi:type II secretion system protein [Kribbella pittospori]|uniref:Type II secretion system protein n=1 Tax=Kribbella pittospori TaxID=722689 RepID=A0A4R0KJW9_9ACTN|nr:type II secretion system protein [Kribbella pittospori]TCC60340.1 type II secretion system protein [Kribbella pittospori]
MSRRPSERGESLLEIMIAVAIMGIAVVAIMAGLTTSIMMSDIHRKQTVAAATVRTYAEAVESYVAGSGYTPCAGASAYSPAAIGLAVPAGYVATATAAQSWSGSSWGACGADNGLQKVTLTVSNGTRATERLDVILRKPCRAADGVCA